MPPPPPPIFSQPSAFSQPRFATANPGGTVPGPPPAPPPPPADRPALANVQTKSPVADEPSLEESGTGVVEVVLQKPEGAKLGVAVLPVREGDRYELGVQKITKGGVVDVWNQLADNEKKVYQGDRILRVNSISNDLDAMVKELQTSCEISLFLARTSSERNANSDATSTTNFSSARAAAPEGPPPPPTPSNVGDSAPPAAPAPATDDATSDQSAPERRPGDAAPTNVLQTGGADEPLLTFDVQIDRRDGERLGLRTLLLTGESFNGFIVDRVIEGGCVDAWNQRNYPFCVQALDCLVRVNGAASIVNMAHEFRSDATRITFTVQRREGGFARNSASQPHGLDADGMSGALQGLIQSNVGLAGSETTNQGNPEPELPVARPIVPPAAPPLAPPAAPLFSGRANARPCAQDDRAAPEPRARAEPPTVASDVSDALALPMPFGMTTVLQSPLLRNACSMDVSQPTNEGNSKPEPPVAPTTPPARPLFGQPAVGGTKTAPQDDAADSNNAPDASPSPSPPDEVALTPSAFFGASEQQQPTGQQQPSGPAAVPTTTLFGGELASDGQGSPAPDGEAWEGMAPTAPPAPSFCRSSGADTENQVSQEEEGQGDGPADLSEEAKGEETADPKPPSSTEDKPQDAEPAPPVTEEKGEEVGPKVEAESTEGATVVEVAAAPADRETEGDSAPVSSDARLLLYAGQLNDDEFVRLLKTELSQRPGLSTYVAQTLSA